MNCYWQMPFRTGAKITLENLTDKKSVIYYQITYAETAVEEDTPYLTPSSGETIRWNI